MASNPRRLPALPSGAEQIGIQLGTGVQLQLTGAKDCQIETTQFTQARAAAASGAGFMASLELLNTEPASVLPVSASVIPHVATSDRHRFSLMANRPCFTSLSAVDAADTRLATLNVIVGSFAKHPSMSIDLIADVGRGADSFRIHALQRMLNNRWVNGDVFTNKDNIFEQNTPCNVSSDPDIGSMTCGIVARFRTDQVFRKIQIVADDWYLRPLHEPLRGAPTKRSDVKYRPEKIAALTTQIVAALTDGKAVRVGVIDNPVRTPVGTLAGVTGKLIAYRAGGHTVIIVGCNSAATEFLYIDPWGGGSWMEYKGGIPGNQVPGKCAQLGILTVTDDPDRRVRSTDRGNNLIRSSQLTEGSFNEADGTYLEVVSAPFPPF